MSLLEVEGLTCRYGPRVAVRDVSLGVERGETLILLGANGAGKTTLLRSLAGQRKPATGAIRLASRDIRTMSKGAFARCVGYLPQSEARNWPLTVIDAVRLGRLAHRGLWRPLTRDDQEIVDEALQATGLRELRDRPITQLSGGEWRRTALARVLAQQAELLLLDEPTTGLDLRFQIEVMELVRRLARERGLTCVISLHDLNLASRYGDRFALLSEGRLLACGTHDEILTPDLIHRAYGVNVAMAPHPDGGPPLIATVGISSAGRSSQS